MSFRFLNVWKKPKEDYLMAHYYVELRLNTVLLEQDAGHSLACGLQGRCHCSRAWAELQGLGISPLAHCRKPLPASSGWSCFPIASDLMIFRLQGPSSDSQPGTHCNHLREWSKWDSGPLSYSHWLASLPVKPGICLSPGLPISLSRPANSNRLLVHPVIVKLPDFSRSFFFFWRKMPWPRG